jgi:hypothetical protein
MSLVVVRVSRALLFTARFSSGGRVSVHRGALPPNNSVNRTQIPLRGLCAGYLKR